MYFGDSRGFFLRWTPNFKIYPKEIVSFYFAIRELVSFVNCQKLCSMWTKLLFKFDEWENN